jgi:hypothetical protein
VRERQPAVEREDRHLHAEPYEEAEEDQELGRRGELASPFGEGRDREGVPRNGVEEHEEADQHEDRSAHGVEDEVERGRAAPLATPAVDEEEERDQRQLPEHVEERPVLCHEHAEHRRFELQEQRVVALGPLRDARRSEDRDQAEEGGEQDHREREAVQPQGVGGSQAGVPFRALVELESCLRGVEVTQQSPGVGQGRRCKADGQPADEAVRVPGQQRDQQGAAGGDGEQCGQRWHLG